MYYSSYINKIIDNMPAKMFLDDFCSDYSISLSKKRFNNCIYRFHNASSKLLNLFAYDFLDYELDKILSALSRDLLIFGKAFLIENLKYNKDNDLCEISYEPLHCKYIRVRKNYIKYKYKTSKGEIVKCRVDRKRVIEFHLKDVGYSKKYFLKFFKKLKKTDLPSSTLVVDENFDWDKFNKTKDYKLLKYTRNIFWDGRNFSNKYVNEPYLLYRRIKYELIRNDFLEYLISQINADISVLGKEYDFSGYIAFDSKTDSYKDLLQDLKEGKKNCEQVCAEVLKV